ncbi:MAG: hypothetical protein KAU06_05610 [Candidatus Marinimicrobia bacterium]|nr:hypothetical protein [Candidatus Neomarinimicrobiota bacterium]
MHRFAGYWLIGYWSLVIGCWLLVAGYWILDMERSEITIYRGWNCQICEYLEKVKLMYRHNSELFFLPFQGAFDQLDAGLRIDDCRLMIFD